MKKRTMLAIVLLVVAAGTVNAMDVLVSGKWTDTGNDSLLNDGLGGNVQVRLPVAENLSLGLSAGLERFSWSPTSSTSGRFVQKSVTTKGNVKAMPLGLSAIYAIPLEKCIVEIEGGAAWNIILDTDVDTVRTTRLGPLSQSSTTSIDIRDHLTCNLGANVVVPIGGISALLGGGYQWQMEEPHTRLMQGAFVKAGIIIPL